MYISKWHRCRIIIYQSFSSFLGITPDKFCDEVSGKFRSLFEVCGISFTDFIRTTEPRHKVGRTNQGKNFVEVSNFRSIANFEVSCDFLKF
jgi:hypothetical protein